ncbi:MAG: lamin tail domain-containing protein [Candidatus Paceibacterota bacterium]
MKFRLGIFIFVMLVSPLPAKAEVVLSEIMYDLEGSDSKREWVEVFNPDGSPVSLSGWRLFESDANHRLTLITGDETLSSGAYAVIANDGDAFLLDWPDFSGTLFDSSFSLSNTGETLIIRDSELVDIHAVTYSSEWGAQGDGKTLYYTGSQWETGIPTPGKGPYTSEDPPQEQPQESQGENTAPVVTSHPVEPQIFARIVGVNTKERVVTVGADTVFTGRVVGLSGDLVSGARYVWSFGDGGSREGESVLYHYRYPGTYQVVLTTSSGKYTASDRLKVLALPSEVSVRSASQEFIEIKNDSDREIDLSWWIFLVGRESFTVPEHTMILPKSSVRFSTEITRLTPKGIDEVVLLYPNMMPVIQGSVVEDISEEQSIVSFGGSSLVGSAVETPYTETSVSNTASADGDPTSSPAIADEDFQYKSQLATVNTDTGHGGVLVGALIVLLALGSGSVLYLRKQAREGITLID